MDSSTSKVGSGEFPNSHPVNNPPSKLKTFWFAIAIIVGLGSLAAAGVGLGGYLQAGSLSSLGRVNSIIMMTAGGVAGIVFLIIGIVGSVKNRQKSGSIEHNRSDRHAPTSNTSKVKVRNTAFIEGTHKGLIRDAARFGKAEWATYFGDIGDEPLLPDGIEETLNSPCPFSGDASVKVKDTHILVLVPATIDGEQVTLNKLQELMQHPKQGHKTNYRFYDISWAKDEHGHTPVGRPHWVLMTRDVIPGSRNKSYANQKAMLEGTGYVLPQAVEAVVCILAEFVASGTYLYGQDPLITYTCCEETVKKGKYPVVVGSFCSLGLIVYGGILGSFDDGVGALRILPSTHF
ncbi:MAG TPA: hypothetical protein VIH61_10495 [Waddliaceae bacterium]